MQVLDYLLKNANSLLVFGGTGILAAAVLWLLIRKLRRKTDAERERERRLALNTSGRMTDGMLTEALASRDDSGPSLLHYQYSVAGVEDTAAQDVSELLKTFSERPYLPGESVTIKYDQQNPYNSMVVCEKWNGLGVGEKRTTQRAPKPSHSGIAAQHL